MSDDLKALVADAGVEAPPVVEAPPTPAPAEGSQDRSEVNWREEIARKEAAAEKRYNDLLGKYQELHKNVLDMVSSGNSPSPVVNEPTPPAHPADADIEQRIRTAIKEETKKTARETEYRVTRDSAVKEACSRYPDLVNEGSDFYSKVNGQYTQKLAQFREWGISPSPTLVLDIANEVALREGRPVVNQSNQSHTNGAPPPAASTPGSNGKYTVNDIPAFMLVDAKRANVPVEVLLETINNDPGLQDTVEMFRDKGGR